MKLAIYHGVPTYKHIESEYDSRCKEGEQLKTVYDDGYYLTTKFNGKFIHTCVM